MILYVFGIIIFFIMLFFIYIRLKYKFWAIQPVFHFYDIYYWFKNVGIINKELPKKNKYTNFTNIVTIDFEKISKMYFALASGKSDEKGIPCIDVFLHLLFKHHIHPPLSKISVKKYSSSCLKKNPLDDSLNTKLFSDAILKNISFVK